MRGISGSVHERLVKALKHLQEQLKNTEQTELAERVKLAAYELNDVYNEYNNAISNTESVVNKYYEIFRNSHEEYIHAVRMKQKALTHERKKKTESI